MYKINFTCLHCVILNSFFFLNCFLLFLGFVFFFLTSMIRIGLFIFLLPLTFFTFFVRGRGISLLKTKINLVFKSEITPPHKEGKKLVIQDATRNFREIDHEKRFNRTPSFHSFFWRCDLVHELFTHDKSSYSVQFVHTVSVFKIWG